MKDEVNIFWFRRDLRLQDNAALYHALQAGKPVLPVFIFDSQILGRLENKKDARVEFIYSTIRLLKEKLQSLYSDLEVIYGEPMDVFRGLTEKFRIGKVFANEDYEPYARERDEGIRKLLKAKNIGWETFKDQVIFSRDEVLKPDGKPYTVFTPYSKKWKSLLYAGRESAVKHFPSEKLSEHYFRCKPGPLLPLESFGFLPAGLKFPPATVQDTLIQRYDLQRDFPGRDATSHLGVHLRFGTLSIRNLVADVMDKSAVFLNELIWRDFYQMILWHFPQVGQGRAFRPEYEQIAWRNNEKEFARWCEGRTGYPLVDAGMRQLEQTGFMHNRIRMVTASFLSKHLLIDWRWGEAWFAEKLLDFELASNNGGWQWAAGCGCDTAPYFRIFNPALQQKKFDPQGAYIKRWLPDLEELDYPVPIVEHVQARERAIKVYKEALQARL